MTKSWQIFYLYWFLFTLPLVLAKLHRLSMAWYVYRKYGEWIGTPWVKEKPPWVRLREALSNKRRTRMSKGTDATPNPMSNEAKPIYIYTGINDPYHVTAKLNNNLFVDYDKNKNILGFEILDALEIPAIKNLVQSAIKDEVATELDKIRRTYDFMEANAQEDTFENPNVKFVTWRGWKMVRNVITDRIEQITGSRSWRPKKVLEEPK